MLFPFLWSISQFLPNHPFLKIRKSFIFCVSLGGGSFYLEADATQLFTVAFLSEIFVQSDFLFLSSKQNYSIKYSKFY